MEVSTAISSHNRGVQRAQASSPINIPEREQPHGLRHSAGLLSQSLLGQGPVAHRHSMVHLPVVGSPVMLHELPSWGSNSAPGSPPDATRNTLGPSLSVLLGKKAVDPDTLPPLPRFEELTVETRVGLAPTDQLRHTGNTMAHVRALLQASPNLRKFTLKLNLECQTRGTLPPDEPAYGFDVLPLGPGLGGGLRELDLRSMACRFPNVQLEHLQRYCPQLSVLKLRTALRRSAAAHPLDAQSLRCWAEKALHLHTLELQLNTNDPPLSDIVIALKPVLGRLKSLTLHHQRNISTTPQDLPGMYPLNSVLSALNAEPKPQLEVLRLHVGDWCMLRMVHAVAEQICPNVVQQLIQSTPKLNHLELAICSLTDTDVAALKAHLATRTGSLQPLQTELTGRLLVLSTARTLPVQAVNVPVHQA